MYIAGQPTILLKIAHSRQKPEIAAEGSIVQNYIEE